MCTDEFCTIRPETWSESGDFLCHADFKHSVMVTEQTASLKFCQRDVYLTQDSDLLSGVLNSAQVGIKRDVVPMSH